jgi:hypothetical protein
MMHGSVSPLVRRSSHVYHHSALDGIRLSVKVEKNSKGYNWEASVSDARSVDEALDVLRSAQERLAAEYGAAQVGGAV